MINSFHRDEKTIFFDFVILMSDNTIKEVRFIWNFGFAFVRQRLGKKKKISLCSRLIAFLSLSLQIERES